MLKTASKVATQSKVYGNLQKFSDSKFFDVTLTNINKINHDSYIYRYQLPDAELPLGLETGQHVVIHAELPTKDAPQGGHVKRKYTPISDNDEKGTFDLLIKIYRRDAHPNFPDGGILTQYLESLKIGDKIKISGPVWRIMYHEDGKFSTKSKDSDEVTQVQGKKLGLICGGTGIAPGYQYLKTILDNPEDKTEVSLLFANKTEEDILLRKELEAYTSDPRFKLYYTLDVGGPEWKGFTGYITPDMIKKTMPAPGDDTLIYLCGNKPMNKMVWGQLGEVGYSEDKIL